MVLEISLVIITLIWLLFASISDLKTMEVPDWISYSLISIGIFIKLTQSIIENNLSILLESALGFTIFFLIALTLYYTKQWGGGDAKLLIGLGIIFPTYPSTLLTYFNPNLNIPFLATILLNLLIAGGIVGMIYTFWILIKRKKDLEKQLSKKKLNILKIFLLLSILIFTSSFFVQLKLKLILISISLILILFPLMKILKSVEKLMERKIDVSKLTEGDWIIDNVYKNKKLIYNKNNPGITLEGIKILKKARIKYVTIKEGIPFIPSFLIAVLASLIYGSPLFFL